MRTECILHDGTPGAGGYARAWIDGRSRRLAKVVLERKLGRPLLPGMITLHSCDNRMCINEDHLSEGTPKQNTHDMIQKGRAGFQQPGHTTPDTKGSNHWQTHLTDQDVRDIRRISTIPGVKQRMIASMYGLTQQTVSGIIRNQIWTHVHD